MHGDVEQSTSRAHVFGTISMLTMEMNVERRTLALVEEDSIVVGGLHLVEGSILHRDGGARL